MGLKTVKKICLALIALFFLAPHVQSAFNLVDVPKLDGAFVPQSKPELTLDSWNTLQFQNAAEKFLNEHFGFRNTMVRFYNQIGYSLFRQSKANSVLVGKEGYLMDNGYIQAFLGRSFLGKENINIKTQQIKQLQDELKANGTDLIVVFSPGKASFFPEYIPDRFHPEHRTLNNHQYYVQRCKELGINYIDFNSYFLQMKDTASYPLFPKCGIHWSYYGVGIAADSLIRYIENKRGIDIPDLYWSKVVVSDSLRDPDYDMAASMNLLYKIPHPPMPYPEFNYRNRAGQTKPKVLTISDSYYYQIYTPIRPHVFEDGGFWYYNEQVISERHPPGTKVHDLNTREELFKQDVVILMSTELNLSNFPWGLIERANQSPNAKNKKPFNRESSWASKRIKEFEQSIRETPAWLLQVAEKAKQKQVSLDEMVRNDAAYMAEMEYLSLPEEPFDFSTQEAKQRVKEVEKAIRESPKWLQDVALKAVQRNIPLNEMIKQDAQYMVEQEAKRE